MNKINLQNVSLKISAGRVNQIPFDLPHIVFSGRSNVGKSTLINKLLSRNKLARTSSAPGKTVTINFYEIDRAYYFVDLPGYGYASKSQSERAKWSELVEGYFKLKNDKPRKIIQLVDLKTGPSADDLMMLEFMRSNGLTYITVATKSDKLNSTDRQSNIKKLEENPLIDKENLIIYSALSNSGIEELRKIIFL